MTALYVGLLDAMAPYDWTERLGSAQRFVLVGHRSLAWPLGGARLAGLVLLIARRRSGLSFPRHPGEWLWVAMACSLVVGTSADLGLFLAGRSLRNPFLHAGCDLAACAIFLVARRFAGAARWQRFFSWVVIVNLARAAWWPFVHATRGRFFVMFWPLHTAITTLLPIVPGVVLAAVVFRERRHGPRYPWPHWVGVGLYLYGCLLHVLWTASHRVAQFW